MTRARAEVAAAVAGCVASGALLLVADGDAPRAWGWVALAGVVAIAASRGAVRAVVGVALAVAGGLATTAHPAGVLLAVTGVLVAIRGPRWPALGARYEVPGRPPADRDVWAAQDRGEDPTA